MCSVHSKRVLAGRDAIEWRVGVWSIDGSVRLDLHGIFSHSQFLSVLALAYLPIAYGMAGVVRNVRYAFALVRQPCLYGTPVSMPDSLKSNDIIWTEWWVTHSEDEALMDDSVAKKFVPKKIL